MSKLTLADFKVVNTYFVHWNDMDAALHVNNLIYLRWCESARIAYLEAMGMTMDLSGATVGPILGYQDCKYVFPMTFPDNAVVGVRCIEAKDDRLILQTAVFSEKHQRLAAISVQEIIPYDYKQLKKAALPEEWAAGVKKIESATQESA